MIKNIVFDFGGVIADISRDKAVQAFFKIGLKDAEIRLDKYHQTGIFQELEEGKLSVDEFRKELSKLCSRELTIEEVQQAWMGFITGIDIRKLDYILELKKSYRIYILSNTNPYVMSWACSPQFSSQGKSLADYCEKLYLSYQIGYTKPEPEIFNFMIKDSKITPSETIFVDDGSVNIGIGKKLGFYTFQPQNDTDWREELTQLLKSLS
ncbi:putative hydrolase of the HAD superfamily [Bacteroides faecichinchillae]|uniref:Putative hydrolase of the HAD superfamily n=1 Tax=Bacteroides faecichinchillae TaxID=871325 RepID=A0A1M4Y2N7_9BACE|nr:HAD family phosphatase [Bacteroides faecichinchillae]THG69211.1 HAD family phosphatase [Bacteroides faecichinchillae]SHF00094.1 putative hydrolase of the HAD superfamily [Bacteroides faecichinchillae]